MANTHWDTLIKGALIFDGSGANPVTADIAIKDGCIAARGSDLAAADANNVVDASGQWLMPGLIDAHTHFDLEVELDPRLPEAVRHGSTTVIASNCSLGAAFGAQQKEDQNPLVDCFARVENMPKPVLQKVVDKVTWNDTGDYLDHFEQLNLGPNIGTMIPHSMLRIEVMGQQDSISREPTEAELQAMEQLMEKGMGEGYIGFSTDALPFHYLAGDPNRKEKIPSQFGSYSEMKRLTHVIRKHERVWQATPPKDSPIDTAKLFALTSGRLFGKPLKVTAVAALDIATNKGLAKLGMLLTRILNSKLLRGHFRLQALAAPFKVYCDGPITPLSEEVPELRLLNEPDLEDRDARLAILNDPAYVKAFHQMWHRGKRGFNLANLARILKRENSVLSRQLADMTVDTCPVPGWNGQNMQAIFERLQTWQATGNGAQSDEETTAFAKFPKPVGDDADFFLQLLRDYDTAFRWWVVTANKDKQVLKKLLFDPQTLPGFNDSGAHLTNMAFYDGNLRALQLSAEDSIQRVAYTIHRLTQVPAEFFGINAGTLAVGAPADVVVINPENLQSYDPDTCIKMEYREAFDHQQMVNRVPDVVQHVWIAGKLAWSGEQFTADFGQQRFGRALRHKDHPAEQPQQTGVVADNELPLAA